MICKILKVVSAQEEETVLSGLGKWGRDITRNNRAKGKEGKF